MFQFSHRNLWIIFFQTFNHNQEELSLQRSQRVESHGQCKSCWTDSPKSPCNSMGPLYFDICTPVFNIRTLDSMYIKFEYVKWISRYIEFEYVFRVICSNNRKYINRGVRKSRFDIYLKRTVGDFRVYNSDFNFSVRRGHRGGYLHGDNKSSVWWAQGLDPNWLHSKQRTRKSCDEVDI